MTRQELYNLCGLKLNGMTATEPKWMPAILRFIGGDYYVLGTKCVDVYIKQVPRGISLVFKQQLHVPASSLLGGKGVEGLLHDVEVQIGAVTLSMANFGAVKYPIVLRNNETVVIV